MTEQREPVRPTDWGDMTPDQKARWFDDHPIEQVVEAAPEVAQESLEQEVEAAPEPTPEPLEQEEEDLVPVGDKLDQRNQGMTGIRRLYPL